MTLGINHKEVISRFGKDSLNKIRSITKNVRGKVKFEEYSGKMRHKSKMSHQIKHLFQTLYTISLCDMKLFSISFFISYAYFTVSCFIRSDDDVYSR